MPSRCAVPLALAAALAGCGGQRVPVGIHHLPAAIATPPTGAAVLRVSRYGGSAQLIRASNLKPVQTIIAGGLPVMTRLLATSGGYEQTVYGTDNAGRLVAVDLKARRSRLVPTSARDLSAGFDGTILGVDSAHHAVRFAGFAPTSLDAVVQGSATLLRGPGDLVLALGNRAGTLEVLGSKGEVRHFAIPRGQVSATWVGDLVAVTTDSGVLFVDPSGRPPARKAPPRFVKLSGTPTVAVFSPSGHRLYVARKTGGLVMIDRFTRTRLRDLPLDGTVDGLRADRSGRWLLAHSTAGDSLRAIDLSRWTVAWSGTAPWGADLPQVADGQTLLIRRKADLVAVDLSGATPTLGGVIPGGAADLYIILPWNVGTGAPPAIAIAAAPDTAPSNAGAIPPSTDSGGAAPPAAGTDPAPATAPPAKPGETAKLYVQVSASQNREWAKSLARQLTDGGFPATVLDPTTSDESYRVVIGPYATREEADAVGRRLARPYFVVAPGPGDS